ncbi:MAG: peptide ABC transporter substrate-binding protein [Chloroflexota bacterium]
MKQFKILSWLTVVALFVTACAGPARTATPADGAPAGTEASENVVAPTQTPLEPRASGEKKIATFIFTQEFDTLNPLYSNMWFSSITTQLWNVWAWHFDDENNPIPILVAEMPSTENGGISEDGRVITFNLRSDIFWSDNEPVTSADFRFTYEMVTNPANAVASSSPYDLIESLETPDERTVVVTFAEPYAAWVGSMWHGLLPKHILQTVFDAEGTLDNAEWNRKPLVGVGPFVFAEWESGSYARFVANENYRLGRPILDEIFIRFVPDDAAQIAALTGGEGDLGTFFSNADVPTLENAGIAVYRVYSGYNEGFYFYLDPEKGHPALQDVNVRQAIAYAIDKEAITRDLLLGLTQPAATIWDNMPYVDPALQAYPYDPDKAAQLLDAAGWKDENGDGVREKDGVDLSLTYGTSTRKVRQDTQAVVQQQLAEVGIEVELLNYDSDLFFAGYAEGGPMATGQLDIFEYSTTPQYPDPDTYDFLCREIPSDESPAGVNSGALCDEALDELFAQQARQVDFAERQQTFYAISRMIYEKAYWVGLWQDPDLWGVSERLKNVIISGATPFFNIIEWDLQ